MALPPELPGAELALGEAEPAGAAFELVSAGLLEQAASATTKRMQTTKSERDRIVVFSEIEILEGKTLIESQTSVQTPYGHSAQVGGIYLSLLLAKQVKSGASHDVRTRRR